MQLPSFTLQQFKIFKEATNLQLSPLTLLYGRNQAGKSTLLQMPYYEKQPYIQPVERLIEEVINGDIRVPRFQRKGTETTWTPEKRGDLLDSLYKAFPRWHDSVVGDDRRDCHDAKSRALQNTSVNR